MQRKGSDEELKKLYQLLDKIRDATLGSDYQTRIQMRQIRDKAIERIKTLETQSCTNA